MPRKRHGFPTPWRHYKNDRIILSILRVATNWPATSDAVAKMPNVPMKTDGIAHSGNRARQVRLTLELFWLVAGTAVVIVWFQREPSIIIDAWVHGLSGIWAAYHS